MKFKFYPFALFLIVTISSCQTKVDQKVQTIEPAEFAEKISAINNAQIVDVRTAEEFSTGHIDKAKNIDWFATVFIDEVNMLDKSKPVFVYCKSGGRSTKAAKKLVDEGFAEIYDLKGGFTNWEIVYVQ